MGKRGPKKGEGGAPRKKDVATRKDGYKRVTIGPDGEGTQVYEHRAKAGMGKTKGRKGKGTVVNHQDHKRSHNDPKNLKKMSKAQNNKS